METIYTKIAPPDLQISIDTVLAAPGLVTEQVGDNLQISTLDLKLESSKDIQTEGPPTFCIAIFLDGKGELSIESGGVLEIEPDMTVVFHSSEPVLGRTLFAGNSHIHCLDFRFSLEYLSSFGIVNLDRIIPMFDQNYSVAKVTMLAKKTSFKLKDIAKQVLDCEIEGVARSLFLQSKALEALSQVLTTLEDSNSHVQLSKLDHVKIQDAISLIEQQYDQPWTIALLAEAVGINQSKLKQGFHLAVQSTVHRYLEEIRLTKAKYLLEQGHKVLDVCLATGYSYPSHFSKRFQQRFSVQPSKLSKQSATLKNRP
ncbi:helix-turn-helix domain-containing protein [Marinomonas sp. 2405UD66-6]|uniref:helix-turn-helix domain-containing protein n=1 Tax=Marinomonas sp. 2405UD66-6 TaxID=3391834 RepID=UPI0039C8C14C